MSDKCDHPADRQMYRQINPPGESDRDFMFRAVIGSKGNHIYREEYCGACGEIFKTEGVKPDYWK